MCEIEVGDIHHADVGSDVASALLGEVGEEESGEGREEEENM